MSLHKELGQYSRAFSESVLGTFDLFDYSISYSEYVNTAHSLGKGIVVFQKGKFDLIAEALKLSTVFHEKVHYWQHFGTSVGFLLSITRPLQALFAISDVSRLSNETVLRKPLFLQAEDGYKGIPENEKPYFNELLNNYLDFDFGFRLIDSPYVNRDLVSERFFHSLGHSLFTLCYRTSILIGHVFPELKKKMPYWEECYEELSALNGADNFTQGGKTIAPSIGFREIAESQARFGEIQYLNRKIGPEFDWDQARGFRLLGSEYTKAFDMFLEYSNLDWPQSPSSSTIDLFLLICEMSLCSEKCFPFVGMNQKDIQDFPEIYCPGFRFMKLSQKIPWYIKELIKSDKFSRSKRDFEVISNEIAKVAGCEPPHSVYQKMLAFWEEVRESDLLNQEKKQSPANGDYDLIGLLVERHLRILEDKLRYPHFFCWAPAKMGILFPVPIGKENFDEPREEESDDDLGDYALFRAHDSIFYTSKDLGDLRYRPLPYWLNYYDSDTKMNPHFMWRMIRPLVLSDIIRQTLLEMGPFDYSAPWYKVFPASVQGIYDKEIERLFMYTFRRGSDEIEWY